MNEEYDDKLKERDDNEDDRVSMNEHGRIMSHNGKIGRGLVQNFLDSGGVDGDFGNIKM